MSSIGSESARRGLSPVFVEGDIGRDIHKSLMRLRFSIRLEHLDRNTLLSNGLDR